MIQVAPESHTLEVYELTKILKKHAYKLLSRAQSGFGCNGCLVLGIVSTLLESAELLRLLRLLCIVRQS